MTWFKVDDAFARHQKVKALRAHGPRVRSDALAIWLLCGVECAAVLGQGGVRDGFVSENDLDDIARPLAGRPLVRAVEALVAVGLWAKVEGGWAFHDWGDHQPTSESIKTQRDRWKVQKRGQRGGPTGASAPPSAPESGAVSTADTQADTAADSSQDSRADSAQESSRRAYARAGARPDPSRPVPSHRDPREQDPSVSALGRLVRGFETRWRAKRDAKGRPLGDMWPGVGKHRGRADEIAAAYAEKPAALDEALDAFFASTKPVVADARWGFGMFASDPGRWVAEGGHRAPVAKHTAATDEDLDAAFGPE